MNRREAIENTTDELAKLMASEGRLIESGFVGLMSAAYPNGVGDDQKSQLRQSFFAGAQHLFGSIMGIMDDDSEPTAGDFKKIDLIDHELQAWIHEFKHANNISDPDIGPVIGTKQ